MTPDAFIIIVRDNNGFTFTLEAFLSRPWVLGLMFSLHFEVPVWSVLLVSGHLSLDASA